MIGSGSARKTVLLSAILLAACLLQAGCGKRNAFEGTKTSDETGFRMEYSILDREESAGLELAEGDRIRVHLSHDAGNADVAVWQDGEEPLYRGTGQENADFVLIIPKAGPYRFSVAGHRARGEASFTRIPRKEG